MQFGALHLSTVVNFSSANFTNKFVTGSMRRTQLSGITFCAGIPIQESDGVPVSTAHSECSRPKCNNSILCLCIGTGCKLKRESSFWAVGYAEDVVQ